MEETLIPPQPTGRDQAKLKKVPLQIGNLNIYCIREVLIRWSTLICSLGRTPTRECNFVLFFLLLFFSNTK